MVIDLLILINHKSFATRWQQGLKMFGIESHLFKFFIFVMAIIFD
jgi:hypothetical protein